MDKQQLKIEASKDFNAGAEAVYQAWTQPDQLKQWWKPMGNTLTDVTNDLKPGGAVKYVFDENTFIISGEYSNVQENKKLEYTWNWEFPNDMVKNGEYKLTVTFSDNGNGSSIHVVQDNFENEESLQVHQQGWDKGLNDLKQFVEGVTNAQADGEPQKEYAPANGPEDSSGGYREVPEQEKVGG